VINVLGRLHKAGWIHWDISPDNIMMDEDGSMKLIDFGGSKKVGLNNQQVFLGKWGFAPLEQMLSKLSEQGPWTDIYGICATLYCIMTSEVPQASYERNEKDELIDIAQYNINIDKKVAAGIMKGLSMNAKDRQQSIDELYKDLYGFYPDEKNAPGAKVVEETAKILKDRTGRIWFGEYPMNEIVGAQLNSDIVYAEYNQDQVAVVNGEKYLRMPVYRQHTQEKDLLSSVMKPKLEQELIGYRYFKFNLLPWKIVQQRKDRVTLQSEYIIDFQPYDNVKYLKMSDKEVSRVRKGICWEKSKIREWLNSVFVRRAFKDMERQMLQVTGINTPVSALSDKITYDKVYIPSIEEIRYGFDKDISLQRGIAREKRSLDEAPCSQYVAAMADGVFLQNSYGLRSRGHVDEDDSYICQEGFEGHAMINNKLDEWRLNKGMGIRPIICIKEDDIEDMT
ncbi:MAG: hypothetical protein K2K20_01015, partial [Lachnospiraceae bacterium]|nr:hypothetical protein [Lachnospiraceae bacterium]